MVWSYRSIWFRRCYQGLVHAYFGDYDGSRASDPTEREGWVELRNFLFEKLPRVLGETKQLWAEALKENLDLLTSEPCQKYAFAVFEGKPEAFQLTKSAIGISDASWLSHKLTLDVVKIATGFDDQRFRSQLVAVMEQIQETPVVLDEALALILNRCAAAVTFQTEPELFDLAVERWGNPLHSRNLKAWDRAGDIVVKMVSGWLKSELIEEFFELLSADGKTDRRRVEFWKQYVSEIDDVYYALGRNAMRDRSSDMVRLRKRMGDNLFTLDGSASSNNGFFMKMRGHIILEFGETGNAAFVFAADRLPFKLGPTIVAQGKSGWRSVASAYLLHMDGRTSWEDEFAKNLRRVCGVSITRVQQDRFLPASRATVRTKRVEDDFSFARLGLLCLRYGVPYRQQSEGTFKVIADDRIPALSSALVGWSFVYDARSSEWTRSR